MLLFDIDYVTRTVDETRYKGLTVCGFEHFLKIEHEAHKTKLKQSTNSKMETSGLISAWQNELKVFFVTFVAAYFAVKKWKDSRKRRLDTPGPRGWPLLG